jgi:hypothetical protein
MAHHLLYNSDAKQKAVESAIRQGRRRADIDRTIAAGVLLGLLILANMLALPTWIWAPTCFVLFFSLLLMLYLWNVEVQSRT